MSKSNRTHCKQGHAYTSENTRVGENGKRRCKTCQSERRAKWHEGHGAIHPAKTYCPKGHLFDDENTIWEGRGSGVRRTCAACQRANRVVQRLKRYGLTPEAYEALMEKQGSVCAICKGEFAFPNIDHHHDGGYDAVRGILCSGCNTGLGAFRDNPALLLAAAEYITQSGRWTPIADRNGLTP